jgi:hypothetical protein
MPQRQAIPEVSQERKNAVDPSDKTIKRLQELFCYCVLMIMAYITELTVSASSTRHPARKVSVTA